MKFSYFSKLTSLSSKLEQFVECCGRWTSWLVLAMVLVTFLIVILRYLFDMGSIALQEMVTYLHSMVFLVGASYTLKYDAHVRVDIFYSRLSESGKAKVDLLGHVFILLPVMVFIIWISWPYIELTWRLHESSQEAGGLPGIYLLKSLIIVMASLLIVQATALILKNIVTIFKRETN